MKLYLDCEFTQLSSEAKLISLALVAENGREFYVELMDTWDTQDCSDFVIEIMFPRLWHGSYAMPVVAAREALLAFLKGFSETLEIVTDAPQFDWELFCELAYVDGRWPSNVLNRPTDAGRLQRWSPSTPSFPLGRSNYRRHVHPVDGETCVS